MTPDLAARAEQYGVALRYTTFWGEDQPVPDEVLARALACMGVDAPQPPEAQGLPPVHVSVEGEPIRMAWTGGDPAATRWQLAPQERPAALAREGELAREGSECVIALPADLTIGYWQLTVTGG